MQEESAGAAQPEPLPQRHSELPSASSTPEEVGEVLKTIDIKLDSLHASMDEVRSKVEDIPSLQGGPSTQELYWAGGFPIIVVLLVLIAFLVARRVARRGEAADGEGRSDPRRPSNLLEYIVFTLTEHPRLYLLLFVLPFLIASGLAFLYEFNVIGIPADTLLVRLLAIWGVLVTVLGAYYALRADSSATRALHRASMAYDAALKFSESLESFVHRVRNRIDEIVGQEGAVQRVRFVSVIPAFGTVGLGQRYKELERNIPDYARFHDYLFRRVEGKQIKRLELLTHGGYDCAEWISDLRTTTDLPEWTIRSVNEAVPSSPPSTVAPAGLEALRNRLKSDYLVQRCFLYLFLRRTAPDALRLFVWRRVQEEAGIPFQFVIVDSVKNTEVFFLFSGDFLYGEVLSLIREKIPMPELVRLSRGYYIDSKEARLVRIFSQIFESMTEQRSREVVNRSKAEFQLIYPPALVVRLSPNQDNGHIDQSIFVNIEEKSDSFDKLVESGTDSEELLEILRALA